MLENKVTTTLLHMETQIWVNTGSGKGLLPDDTKLLAEPMLTSD